VCCGWCAGAHLWAAGAHAGGGAAGAWLQAAGGRRATETVRSARLLCNQAFACQVQTGGLLAPQTQAGASVARQHGAQPCRLLRPTPSALRAFEGSVLGPSASAAEAEGTADPARTRSSRSSGTARRRLRRVMASTDEIVSKLEAASRIDVKSTRPRATPTMLAQCLNCAFLIA
jgi:hypothetical protein